MYAKNVHSNICLQTFTLIFLFVYDKRSHLYTTNVQNRFICTQKRFPFEWNEYSQYYFIYLFIYFLRQTFSHIWVLLACCAYDGINPSCRILHPSRPGLKTAWTKPKRCLNTASLGLRRPKLPTRRAASCFMIDICQWQIFEA